MTKRDYYYYYIHVDQEEKTYNDHQRIYKYAHRRKYNCKGKFVDVGDDAERSNWEKLLDQIKENDILICTNVLALSEDYKTASSRYFRLLQKRVVISFIENPYMDSSIILREFEIIDEIGDGAALTKEIFLQTRIRVVLELTPAKLSSRQPCKKHSGPGMPRGAKAKLTDELKADILEYLYGEEHPILIKDLKAKHHVASYRTMQSYIKFVKEEHEKSQKNN